MADIGKLIADLSSPDRLVRIAAADPVAALSEDARDALPALERWLTNDEPFFRVVGAATILKIDPFQAERMISVLIDGLSCEPCPVPCFAAEVLGDLGPAAARALPALKKCLEGDSLPVRSEAASAIWKITGRSSPDRP